MNQPELPPVALSQDDHQLSAIHSDSCTNIPGMNPALAASCHCSEAEMQSCENNKMETNSSQHCSWMSNPTSQTDSSDSSHIVNRYLNEPVLVCESSENQLPQTVLSAYALCQPASSTLAVFVVINILMSELGFKLHKVSFKFLALNLKTMIS